MTKEERREKLLKKIEDAEKQLELLDAPTQLHEVMDAGILSCLDGELVEIEYDETTTIWQYIRYLTLYAFAQDSGHKRYYKTLSEQEKKLAVGIAENFIKVWNNALRDITNQKVFTKKEKAQIQENISLKKEIIRKTQKDPMELLERLNKQSAAIDNSEKVI